MIGQFDWQYQGDGGDIRHCISCGKFCLSLPGKEFVCKILQFSVYTCSRIACVQHGVCFWQCLWSLAHKPQGCVRHSANWTWEVNYITQLIPDAGKYLYLTGYSYPRKVKILIVCPLKSLVDSCICELRNHGISATSLSTEDVSESNLLKEAYASLLWSPEALLQYEKGRKLLHNNV